MNSVKKVFTSCMIVLIVCGISMGSVQSTVNEFLVKKKYAGDGIGVVVNDAETGKTIVSVNGNNMFNPASVTKLTTAAASFELLKSNFEFKTQIFTNDTYNSDSGIIHGDLYIRGGGDPGFTAERLWLLVQHLRHQGLKKITGNLVLDDFFYDTVIVGPGFDEDSNSRAYQPLVSALSANFNTLAIHHRSGQIPGSPVHIDIFPEIAGVTVKSTAKTVASSSAASLDVQTVPSVTGTSVVVRGSSGVNQASSYIYRKVWQSWENFGGAIKAQFDKYGIILDGKIVHGKTPDQLLAKPAFYEFPAQPFRDFVDDMFKYSSNFAAEMIFKRLSATDSIPGSWPRSSAIVLDWWKKNKFPGEPVILNGSGMGNTNRMSPLQIVSVLDHVWHQKQYLPEYLSALSISGVDGTLKSRFKNSPLKGIVRGKTGTLNSYQVSTLAGYILSDKGTYSFAVICNGAGKGQYDNWVVQEEILEKVYDAINKGEN